MSIIYNEQNRQSPWRTSEADEAELIRGIDQDDFLMPALSQAMMAPAAVSPERQALDEQEALARESLAEARTAADKEKPFWAPNPVAEVAGLTANAAIGVATDYLDLFALAGDVVRAGASQVGLGSFDAAEIGQESDNWWTVTRRQTFESQSQVGEMVSPLLRIGAHFLTSGGIGALAKKGIVTAAAGGSVKAQKIGRVAQWWSQLGGVSQKLTTGQKLSPGASKLIGTINASDDYLRRSAAGILRRNSKSGGIKLLRPVGDIGKGAVEATRAAISKAINRPVAAAADLGKLMLQDALFDFMITDPDEMGADGSTFGDFLATTDNSLLQGLGQLTATDSIETAMSLKAKAAMEGAFFNLLISPAIDSFRIASMGWQMRSLSKVDQDRVLLRITNPGYDDLITNQLSQARALLPPASRTTAQRWRLRGGQVVEEQATGLDRVGEGTPNVRIAKGASDAPAAEGTPDVSTPEAFSAESQVAKFDDPIASEPGALAVITPETDALLQRVIGLRNRERQAFEENQRRWAEAEAMRARGAQADQARRRYADQPNFTPQVGQAPVTTDQPQTPGPRSPNAPVEQPPAEPPIDPTQRPDRYQDQQSFSPVRDPNYVPGDQAGPPRSTPTPTPTGPADVGRPLREEGFIPGGGELRRPVEVTTTPEKIRAAVHNDARKLQQDPKVRDNPDKLMAAKRQLEEKALLMLPARRTDRIDWLQKYPPQINEYGVIDFVDGNIWGTSVQEGLLSKSMRVSDEGRVQVIREPARQADQGDRYAEIAKLEKERVDLESQKASQQVVDVQATPVEEEVVDIPQGFVQQRRQASQRARDERRAAGEATPMTREESLSEPPAQAAEGAEEFIEAELISVNPEDLSFAIKNLKDDEKKLIVELGFDPDAYMKQGDWDEVVNAIDNALLEGFANKADEDLAEGAMAAVQDASNQLRDAVRGQAPVAAPRSNQPPGRPGPGTQGLQDLEELGGALQSFARTTGEILDTALEQNRRRQQMVYAEIAATEAEEARRITGGAGERQFGPGIDPSEPQSFASVKDAAEKMNGEQFQESMENLQWTREKKTPKGKWKYRVVDAKGNQIGQVMTSKNAAETALAKAKNDAAEYIEPGQKTVVNDSTPQELSYGPVPTSTDSIDMTVPGLKPNHRKWLERNDFEVPDKLNTMSRQAWDEVYAELATGNYANEKLAQEIENFIRDIRPSADVEIHESITATTMTDNIVSGMLEEPAPPRRARTTDVEGPTDADLVDIDADLADLESGIPTFCRNQADV